MTQFPEDDQALIRFLKQNQPQAPPASAELETQIMQAVAQEQMTATLRQPFWTRPRIIWGAIAASLITGWVSYRILLPPTPSAAELASLETFLEASWRGTVNDNPEEDVLPVNDTDTN